MSNYVKEYLGPLIGEEVTDDMIQYIMSLNNEADYIDFMENIVDFESEFHLELFEKLKNELFGRARVKKDIPNQSIEPQYNASSSATGKKKKSKYTNFYSQDNRTTIRNGRHPCNCQATKHELINNCTKCGRIVCEQEGSGPCLFCENMVCTRDEMHILNASSKESSRLYNYLMEQKTSKEFKRAIKNRDKLISTDQMGVVKNKVFDDQNDYFDVNSKWLNEEDKVELKKRYRANHNLIHKSRRDFKMALDFASRTVILEDEQQNKQKANLLKGVNKLLDDSDRRFPKNLFDGENGKLVTEIVKLMEECKVTTANKKVNETKSTTVRKYRIANPDFLETVDQGMCLSMHQPWASLLVAGIKVHEGRTWRTEHRGRLWIAAAAKDPDDEDILQCEEMYRVLYNDPALEFPKKYPTGCLLGCVFVEDCLDQRNYQEKYPGGESGSPFVLICSSPVILPVFYPMQGQHKIFQLNKELHRTAKSALLSSKWM